MKKINLISLACFCALTSMITLGKASQKAAVAPYAMKHFANDNYTVLENAWIDSLYANMKLNAAGLSAEAFKEACKGYQYLLSTNSLAKPNLLSICDYSKSSTAKRLFVIDIQHEKLLYNTYVSHGRNSGDEFATSFSNSNDSHKTSLGFMITAETYTGGNGYSMRFDGQEKSINNNVRMRDIVMHGSDYVNAKRAAGGSMMGRSYGCPAVPLRECKKIIDCIKGGSCFFAFYPDNSYQVSSSILNADFEWPVVGMLRQKQLYAADTSIVSNNVTTTTYPSIKLM